MSTSVTKNRKKRQANLEIFRRIIPQLNNMDIIVNSLTPYQYRLTRGRRIVDYYPTSNKIYDINYNQWRVIDSPLKILRINW
jgi:hypothetical protein